jgi:DNA repair protein RadA/Sms
MAKPRQVFVCKECGSVQTRWMGKCPDCNAWDSLQQESIEKSAKTDPRAGSIGQWSQAAMTHAANAAAAQMLAEAAEGGGVADGLPAPAAERMVEQLTTRQPAQRYPQIGKAAELPRRRTGIDEFDRVLGGGLVPASAVLIGGDPGIGKSTLLLQAAASWARTGARVLYVSSEESVEQVKLRAGRLLEDHDAPAAADTSHSDHTASPAAGLDELFLLSDSSLSRICEQAARVLGEVESHRRVLIIDSVQMVYKPDLAAFPGSMSQLRQCCAELVYMAKATGTAVVLIGHVTKEGTLAGPKLLEHLVDSVLYFEGDRYHAHRVLRCVKNRFGSTLELGLFEMTDGGLRQATGQLAIAGGPARSGTVICPVQTGSRCLLVEVQALTATSFPGMAKRKASGIDANRLAMLIAVLEQHGSLRLEDRDIFVSAVGGVKITEPAADLATLLAISGAHYRKAVSNNAAAVGEVGLGGEIRPVTQLDARVQEAAKLGARTLLVPASQAARIKPPAGVRIIGIRTVGQALSELEVVPGTQAAAAKPATPPRPTPAPQPTADQPTPQVRTTSQAAKTAR